MTEPLLLEMKQISKQFPGVKALENVSFNVRAGEVHALIGENGAGKSTLMKILSGIYQQDEGQIFFNGQLIHFHSPHDAWTSGISTIHQELMVVPQLSVAENIFLGRLPQNRMRFFNRKAMHAQAAQLLERMEIQLDPHTLVGDLPVALQQMVEIAKALSINANLIVMDEPTSALSKHEIDILFERIKRLRTEGRSVVFISHKLDEIFEISDQITVLRDGHWIGQQPTAHMDKSKLIQMMVGRELRQSNFEGRQSVHEKALLEVHGLTIDGLFYDIDFSLYPGEILGIAGLVGAGRSDVIRAIFGAEKIESGSILLDGKPVQLKNPRSAIRKQIGFVPENRKEEALLLQMNVQDNILLPQTTLLSKAGLIQNKREQAIASEFTARLSVRTPSLKQKTVNLSGGNQQKVILARWLATQPRILIVDEPTRGIDVAARAEIHALLHELANRGMAILMVSSEMEEILALSDRIIVMRDGRIEVTLQREEADQQKIVAYALGVQSES
jgi:ABC-type sugar transport system ATPase subunit